MTFTGSPEAAFGDVVVFGAPLTPFVVGGEPVELPPHADATSAATARIAICHAWDRRLLSVLSRLMEFLRLLSCRQLESVDARQIAVQLQSRTRARRHEASLGAVRFPSLRRSSKGAGRHTRKRILAWRIRQLSTQTTT